jgi:hypothetical protein
MMILQLSSPNIRGCRFYWSYLETDSPTEKASSSGASNLGWIRRGGEKRNIGITNDERKTMKKSLLPILLIAAGAFLNTAAQADDIQFTTLPQTVQTTVVRETHIQGSAGVVRVIRDTSGIYAVTVRGDAGDQVVYVNDAGAIVQAPAAGTTTTTTVQSAQPVTTTEQTVVTSDEVQKSQSRYELLEKKGKKEIYLDHQTGQKVTVKREND